MPWKFISNEPDPTSVVLSKLYILGRQLKKKGILTDYDLRDMDFEWEDLMKRSGFIGN